MTTETNYETITVNSQELQSLTEAGRAYAEELGLRVDVDPYGAAYAVREGDEYDETIDLDNLSAHVDHYVDVTDDSSWGDAEITDEEHEAACDRMEAWLTEHEGELLSIQVRPARSGEAAGIYELRPNGNLQILGYSIPVPDEVQTLINAAWQHACETWPNDNTDPKTKDPIDDLGPDDLARYLTAPYGWDLELRPDGTTSLIQSNTHSPDDGPRVRCPGINNISMEPWTDGFVSWNEDACDGEGAYVVTGRYHDDQGRVVGDFEAVVREGCADGEVEDHLEDLRDAFREAVEDDQRSAALDAVDDYAPNDVIKIEVCEDANVGGPFLRAYQVDGQERDIPMDEDAVTACDGDPEAVDSEIRHQVECDALVGRVLEDCEIVGVETLI